MIVDAAEFYSGGQQPVHLLSGRHNIPGRAVFRGDQVVIGSGLDDGPVFGDGKVFDQGRHQKLASVAEPGADVFVEQARIFFIKLINQGFEHGVADMGGAENPARFDTDQMSGVQAVLGIEALFDEIIHELSAQNQLVRLKQIRGFAIRQQQEIVIEIDEPFGKARNAVQGGFDGHGIIGGQAIFMTAKNNLVVDDFNTVPQVLVQTGQVGRLIVGDNPDAPDPRREFADGFQAIDHLIALNPASLCKGLTPIL